MNKRLIYILEASLVIICIITLAVAIFGLPRMAAMSAENFPEVAYLQYPILLGIYLACMPFYMGIYQTFRLIRLIKKEDAFNEQACGALRVITISAICVIILFMIGTIYLNVENALPPALFLTGIIIIFAACVIAVFAEVLRALLMKVIDIKNENDLTI
jgi:hypothetical protein